MSIQLLGEVVEILDGGPEHPVRPGDVNVESGGPAGGGQAVIGRRFEKVPDELLPGVRKGLVGGSLFKLAEGAAQSRLPDRHGDTTSRLLGGEKAEPAERVLARPDLLDGEP